MLLAITSSSVLANDIPAFDTDGFATLANKLGDRVGTPLADEFATPEGTMQITSSGAVYWHSLTGILAFTDGWSRVALIGDRIVEWAGERQEPPVEVLPTFSTAVFGATDRADCIIAKESGGHDVPNMQGSGATGPGQYMPSTWASHVAIYRAATGYLAALSLHVLADVRRVMAFILTLPGKRSAWAVAGC